MGRLNMAMVAVTIAAAVALYLVNYRTRQLALEVSAAEARLAQLVREIDILKADRVYLSRPERIEPIARALGMVPADGRQFTTIEAFHGGKPAGARP